MSNFIQIGKALLTMAAIVQLGSCGSVADDSTVSMSQSTVLYSDSGDDESVSGETVSCPSSGNGVEICDAVAGRNLCFFESAPIFMNAAGVQISHVADLDNDGRQEVLIQEINPYNVWVLHGDPCESTSFELELISPERIYDIRTLDANADGYLDLLIGAPDALQKQGVLLFLNNGGLEFSRTVVPLNKTSGKFQVADLDDDGKTDIIATTNNAVRIFWGEGEGFAEGPKVYVGGEYIASNVEAIDFNTDGRLDLVTVRSVRVDDFTTYYEVVVHFGDPQLLFEEERIFFIAEVSGYPTDILIEDYNLDGNPDFALSGAIVDGDGAGDVSAVEGEPGLIGSLAAGDLDGDGRTDLVSSLGIFMNDGESFEGVAEALGLASEIHTGDVNGDGLIDLVDVEVTAKNTVEVVVHINARTR